MGQETDSMAEIDRSWWKESVVYQIYPRSFNDSDGDGIGDIPGIVEKADYLDDLGIDVVWLCPVYDSPNADNGYDIRDYHSIMDEFGDFEDWEALRDALHERDIKLIMDLVVNHTSDEHEWFEKSRREEEGYAEYYHWVEGNPEEPPNNWESFFGGPAWSYDDQREAWYLHLFDEKQPDLNWRNPDVRADVKEMITWWLERGIDGFRMDVIDLLSKPEGYPDGDGSTSPTGFEQFAGGPHIHEYLRELYDDVFSKYDIMTVGEMAGATIENAPQYLGPDGDGLNMLFHFEHMAVDQGPDGQWDLEDWGEWELSELKDIVSKWQRELDGEGWNAVYLGNHDQPRIVSRFGDDGQYREESATLLATFLNTLRGTPYVYQGEEIGMTNADFASLEEVDDVMTIGPIEELLEAGEIESYEDVRDLVNYRSRDHARTPVQWSGEENADFTDGEPWIKLNDNYTDINVEADRADADSIWHYYRDVIDLRHREEALVYGDFELLCPDDEQLFAYTRTLGEETLLVVLNWSDGEQSPPAASAEDPTLLLGNYADADASLDRTLRPYEARIYRL